MNHLNHTVATGILLTLFVGGWALASRPPELTQGRAWSGRGTIASPRGSWERYHSRQQDGKTELVVVESTDSGMSWSQPRFLCHLPGEGWGGTAALRTSDGELQIFMVRTRRENDGNRPAVDRFIDLWHLHSSAGQTRWSEPKCLYQGWLGSISNAIQMSSGRIVMPFGMLIGGRAAAPPTGRHEVTVVYSDDGGSSFTTSAARLTSPCYPDYNGSNEGACEPAIVQLRDGRVLMLMRTQTGYLYESVSSDGANWPEAKPSIFHSSTGPPYLLRLSDDRIMLFWNNCEMPPRVDGVGVYGGRDALHAAIADPDLKSWRGFREIYRDGTRNTTPPKRGDRGTAYPDAIQMADGRVAVVSGQGGRRALMWIDPQWLYEREASDSFVDGLDAWCVYKGFGPPSGWWRDRTQGAELIAHPEKPNAKALHVRRADDKSADGAVWNFPMSRSGRVSVRIRLEEGSSGGTIALGDHFFDPCDDAGEAKSIFFLPLAIGSRLGEAPVVEAGKWMNIELQWDLAKSACRVSVDGQPATTLDLRNATVNGVCYLRLRSSATAPDAAGLLVESASARIDP